MLAGTRLEANRVVRMILGESVVISVAGAIVGCIRLLGFDSHSFALSETSLLVSHQLSGTAVVLSGFAVAVIAGDRGIAVSGIRCGQRSSD